MKAAPRSEETKMVLPVSGMHCASCVSKVEKAVGGLAGVTSVAVHLPSRTVEVVFRPGGGVDFKALKRAIERAGYDVLGATETRSAAENLSLLAEQQEQSRLIFRLEVAAALSLPLISAGALNLSPYTALLLALPLQIYGGWHFHEGLARSLVRRAADMNTLVSLSTWAAFLFSAYVVLFPETLPPAARQTQWDAVAGLITIVTFGRWLESKTRGKTNEAVLKLMRIAPKTARVAREGKELTVPIAQVKVGETILVRPGEQIAMDGVVLSGTSTLDEALLTGESMPVEKAPGSRVWGGTINKTGSMEVRVSRPGSESAVARIVEAVRMSQATKPRIQKFADTVASYFVPFIVLTAVAGAVLWALYGPEPKVLLALTCLVSVLAVACPCALGLATPLAVIAGMGHAAELGVFIRNADVLEETSSLDVILFDKTGTLTRGRPQVVEMVVVGGSREDILRYALAAEQRSEHPFASAIISYAKAEKTEAAPVDYFEAFPGRGVMVKSGGKTVRAGSLSWLKEMGCPVPAAQSGLLTGAVSMLGLAVDSDFLGAFILSDTLRPSAREAVERLVAMGLEVVLVSGDRNEIAYRIAEQAGIGRVFAEVLPEEKMQIVQRLQSEGKKVAMVGEGFNDAPALSQADVGIALASGTDIAIEAADVTIMNPDLTAVAAAIALSRRIRQVIRENLLWAFSYNLLLVPVAAGVLYPRFGILLKPAYAGAAMALSSISVALNSLRLRKV
ncbi:MAG: copper-translocating P-type ATPase [Elusimicrobia bacterium]|nr:copper-translocating P-type ATPase [Elusimicrobiota bacterium]